VLRYRFAGANGQAVDASDMPTSYTDPMSGNTAVIRTNGFLRLARSRFAMSLAMLVNDHIRSSGVENGMDTFSAVGLAVPGLLEGASRFAVTGGQASYALEPLGADGLRVTFGPNAVVDLTRTGEIPGAAQVNAVGAAERLRPETQRPLTNPRVALFWVRPGERGRTERNGVALRFTGPWSPFPLTLADPPEPAVRYAVGGVPLAVAMILVYDDLNNNRVMDLASGDSLRGISNITVVWRGEGGDPAAAAFRQSAFADLGAGYHFAWRVQDFSTNGVTLLPFDGARPISPDAPVSPTELDPLMLESAWR
jgi:hypothetical protein